MLHNSLIGVQGGIYVFFLGISIRYLGKLMIRKTL
jgi:hypothetical protein